MQKLKKKDLDDLNFKPLYEELYNYFKIYINDEVMIKNYSESMLAFSSAIINKYYLEPVNRSKFFI